MNKVQKRKFTLALNHYLQAKTRARNCRPHTLTRFQAIENEKRKHLYRAVEELVGGSK